MSNDCEASLNSNEVKVAGDDSSHVKVHNTARANLNKQGCDIFLVALVFVSDIDNIKKRN